MGKKAKFRSDVLVDLTEVLAKLERVEEAASILERLTSVVEKLARPPVASVVVFGTAAEQIGSSKTDSRLVPFVHCSTHRLDEEEVFGEFEPYRPIQAGAYVVVVGPASLGYLIVGHDVQSVGPSNGPLNMTTQVALPGQRIRYSLKRW